MVLPAAGTWFQAVRRPGFLGTFARRTQFSLPPAPRHLRGRVPRPTHFNGGSASTAHGGRHGELSFTGLAEQRFTAAPRQLHGRVRSNTPRRVWQAAFARQRRPRWRTEVNIACGCKQRRKSRKLLRADRSHSLRRSTKPREPPASNVLKFPHEIRSGPISRLELRRRRVSRHRRGDRPAGRIHLAPIRADLRVSTRSFFPADLPSATTCAPARSRDFRR